MAQLDVEDLPGPSVANFEGPGRPQTQARDAGGVDFRFVVSVPTHAVLSIAVPIHQHTVVVSSRQLHDPVGEHANLAVQGPRWP